VLVKFQKDWADEFDVYGYKIYNSEADWLKEKGDLSEHTFMFGTNEGWEDEGDFEDDDFTVTEITPEEAATIRKLFGNSWGHFPF
jgi:hypothetical protein